MLHKTHHSFFGLIIGFICAVCLLGKRDKKPQDDSAEFLLQSAQQQMKEAQAKNRERMVQIITQKNNLQALVDQTQMNISRLEERAQAAAQEGDSDRELSLLQERDEFQTTLAATQASLEKAIITSDEVKTAMRRQEEHIRSETARALAMKAQSKEAEIIFAIEKSRLSLTTSLVSELFARAQFKIQQAQAKRNLMTQIRKTVETLELTAENALQNGDKAEAQHLFAERDRLKETALNPILWQ